MNKQISAAVVVISLGLGAFAWAHEEMAMPAKPSSPEFQQVKQLVGEWKGVATHSDKQQKSDPVSVQFKLTSAGSAIEETLMPGTPHEMIDMYTDENGKLAMTHYCAMGNQPHLVLKQADAKQINLEMGPTTGIDSSKDAHMHALTLEFKDADHLTEKWTSYASGKPGETAVFDLTRVKS